MDGKTIVCLPLLLNCVLIRFSEIFTIFAILKGFTIILNAKKYPKFIHYLVKVIYHSIPVKNCLDII